MQNVEILMEMSNTYFTYGGRIHSCQCLEPQY